MRGRNGTGNNHHHITWGLLSTRHSASTLPTSAHQILRTSVWGTSRLLCRQGNKVHKIWVSYLHVTLLSGRTRIRTQVCQAPESMFLMILCHDGLCLFYLSIPTRSKNKMWLNLMGLLCKVPIKVPHLCPPHDFPAPTPSTVCRRLLQHKRKKGNRPRKLALLAALSVNGKVCCCLCPTLLS